MVSVLEEAQIDPRGERADGRVIGSKYGEEMDVMSWPYLRWSAVQEKWGAVVYTLRQRQA